MAPISQLTNHSLRRTTARAPTRSARTRPRRRRVEAAHRDLQQGTENRALTRRPRWEHASPVVRESTEERASRLRAERVAAAAAVRSDADQRQEDEGLDELGAWLPFLDEAGFEASVADGRLLLNGKPVMRIEKDKVIYPSSGGIERRRFSHGGLRTAIHQLVLTFAHEQMVERCRSELAAILELRVESVSAGARIMAESLDIGLIEPSRCLVHNMSPVEGCFLAPGAHWVELRNRCEQQVDLAGRARERASGRAGVCGLGLVRSPPLNRRSSTCLRQGCPEPLVARCLAASKEIRLHRRSAYSHPARLTAEDCSIVIDPVLVGRLEARFAYLEREVEVIGVLQLGAKSDPLRVSIFENPISDRGINAWAAVLLGFAALTVPETDWTREPRERSGASAPKTAPKVSTRDLPRRQKAGSHWSNALSLGAGGASTAHWVVGHVRWLSWGQEPSEQKRAEARELGIDLADDETWVRPHVRGPSTQSVMPFRWSIPPN